MSGSPVSDGDSTRSIHRARPSLVSNVSGLAESTLTYGSIMSADGLARLSQFPPVPIGLPSTPLQNSFSGPPSPVGSNRTMTSPAGPRRALPIPPSLVPPEPLSIHKKAYPTSPGLSPGSHSPSSPPYTSGSGKSSYPSPHDWHDGSSSIASDPYGEAVLSTDFITSLLSAVDDPSGRSPQASSGRRYEPSVASNALTVDSTITYPPPKSAPPPPMPTSFKYPPQPAADRSSTSGSSSMHSHIPPQTLQLPSRHFTSIEGRFSPETWASDDSGSAMGQTVIIGPGSPSQSRVLPATPSIQSMTSSTPLINAVPQSDPIAEEDEPRTGTSSGPSTGRMSRNRERRSSVATTRTSKSYMSSLVTRFSHSTGERRSLRQTTMAWFRGKPLPPVPPLPDHAFQEIQIRKREDELPLPALVTRAATLSHLLDKGHRPYDSAVFEHVDKDGRSSVPAAGPSSAFGDVRYSGADPNLMYSARGRKWRSGDYTQAGINLPLPPSPGTPSKSRQTVFRPLSKKRKIIASLVAVFIIAIIAIAVAVGVVWGKKSRHSCSGNMAGAACDLDATCVCAVTVGGQCTNLAQSLVDLVPGVNNLFNVNLTVASVATSIWQVQGLPSGPNCADQTDLIDVAPALDKSFSPNRTRWAQAALLWNLAMSESTSSTARLQSFIQSAPWQSLSSSDGAVTDSKPKFKTTESGFQFDFAAQSILAPSRTYAENGQPDPGQDGRLSPTATSALDRMYTFSFASSTQQLMALQFYWNSTLRFAGVDLNKFIGIVRGSPVLLPFDAVAAPGGHNISSLLSNTSSTPFPPPLSCYPGLSAAQLQVVHQLETAVFGLASPSSQTIFDPTCYPDHPTYGILDVLQLRTPFVDGRAGVAKQAAVLVRDVMPRTVVYSGEVVSAFPGSANLDGLSTDPRLYGTLALDGLNHVILRYLKSIGDQDLNLARELVTYILTSPTSPPTSQTLLDALPSLPVLEVAVFGTIDPSDVSLSVSSLADPFGGLFFGTDASVLLREWASSSTHGSKTLLLWSESATSQSSVKDPNPDSRFTDTFMNASLAIKLGLPDVNVTKIASVFESNGLTSSSSIFPSS